MTVVNIVDVLGVYVWILPRHLRPFSDCLTWNLLLPPFFHVCFTINFFTSVKFLACVFRRWLCVEGHINSN